MSSPLKCLIVDDEPLGRRAVVARIDAHPLLESVGECRNGLEAAAALRTLGDAVDAVFLDLQMPHLGGFDLVRSLARPPLVVIVTAFPDRALEGFEVGVVDYLAKPVSDGRFALAAQRLLDAARAPHASPEGPLPEADLFVSSDGGVVRVPGNEVQVVEAWGNYVRIHTADRSVLTKRPLHEIEAKLPTGFVRVHRSHVIALAHVSRIEPKTVWVGSREVPLIITVMVVAVYAPS